jgi:hypothetical protein
VISFLVYGHLKLITDTRTWVFTNLSHSLGFHGEHLSRVRGQCASVRAAHRRPGPARCPPFRHG